MSNCVDCTDFFKGTPFRVFQAPYVGAVVMQGGASQPRRTLDGWQDFARQRGHRGLAYVLVGDDGELGGPVAKNLSDEERAGIVAHVGAAPGDCIFFAAGGGNSARALLGATRLEIGRRNGLIDESQWSFVWVVDAPLFEPSSDAVAAGDVAVGSGAWTAVHHAFTSPKPEYLDTFDTDPGSALAYAYDIVCNGNEIGGGSIRIHRRDVQERVFAVMGLTQEEAQTKFGFLLDAFKYGAPPHGGIAFGWDRICALLTGAESMREVVAFPKTGGGYDPLTGAPAPITPEQRKEAGIDYVPGGTRTPSRAAPGRRPRRHRRPRSRGGDWSSVDLDQPPVLDARQPAERATEQFAQLGLARQPHRVVRLDRVQGPLDRAVEADHLAGRELVHLDGHVRQREHLVVHAAVGDDEPIAAGGFPPQPAVAQLACECHRDHVTDGSRREKRPRSHADIGWTA